MILAFFETFSMCFFSQVSPCMADKWESLLSNLGHTYRKLRRFPSHCNAVDDSY